jgi:hypothetical protein
MAAVALNLGPRGELARITQQTATGTDALDVEIQPDAACLVTLNLSKPAGAATTIKHVMGSSGTVVDLVEAGAAATAANIRVADIECRDGDEIRVDVDTTSGAKSLDAEGRRFSA